MKCTLHKQRAEKKFQISASIKVWQNNKANFPFSFAKLVVHEDNAPQVQFKGKKLKVVADNANRRIPVSPKYPPGD